MLLKAAAALTAFVLAAGAQVPVWIDTDPSMAPGGHEIDDGYALLQAFHSPELAIRGISIVFGNAPLERAFAIGQEFTKRFGPAGMPVHRGAAGAEDLGKETAASRALAAALAQEPLSVFVLGPATNVATVLKNHPDLRSRIVRIIAVAGRRPGQRFVTGDKKHPPFRDFNFELDSQAFQIILDSGVPLILAPWEISSQVWLTERDIDELQTAGKALEWLTPAARDRLSLWKKNFGVDGFNPFDTLAIGYLTSPKLITCETLPVAIRMHPDDGSSSGATKPYLLVSRDMRTKANAEYCYRPHTGFKADLMKRLHASGASR
jgi:pyrimidine-specific ribonucleoside hydrolase